MSVTMSLLAASAFVVAMGAPLVAAAGTAPADFRQGSVLAMTLDEMNCSSSDSSNQIPCEKKGRS